MSEKEKESKALELENEALVGPKVNLDAILEQEVGQFGKFQWKLLLLTMPIVLCLASTNSDYLFTAARIRTRCLIPECENVTDDSQFSTEWMEVAIPKTEAGFDQCHRFAPVNISSEHCSHGIFDRNSTVPCEKFVYENHDTVVYEFGLACQEWRRSMIGSVKTLGTLASLPLTGYMSDRWGRRTALIFNLINSSWIGLLRYFANSYTFFILAEFFETILGAGCYTCIYILRNRLYNTLFALGHIFGLGIVWSIPYWRTYTLVLYSSQLLITSTLRFIPESVRWYMSKGYYNKCQLLLENIANANGKQLSIKSVNVLQEMATGTKKDIYEKINDDDDENSWLVVQVFRHKPILLRCIVAPVWWISFTFIYYGLTVNSLNLKIGNKYVNFLAISLAEIVGYWSAWALINRLGRKPVLAVSFWLCALSQIGYIFTPIDSAKTLLVLYLVGKWSIAKVVTALYLYTSELFPSKNRHSLIGFCSMIGRFGSILAPLTPAFGDYIPFALFAGMGAASGSLVLLTPETLGSKLPDTMEEAAQIGRSRKTTR